MLRSLLLSLFVSFVAATNSGILGDNGNVINPPTSQPAERDISPSRFWPEKETNAHRMRAGLGPLRPTRWFSPTERALRPRSSPTSCSTISSQGVIAVYGASAVTPLGYVSRTFDNQNSYTYGPIGNALTVSLPTGLTSGVAFEITAVNGPDSNHPFLGAVGGSGGYNFNPNSLGFAYLAGTGHTAANTPPSSSAGTSIQSIGYNGPSESTIWKLNCATLQLTAQWTNVDHSQPSTSLYYDAVVNYLGLVGDYSKFAATYPNENSQLVTFVYVPTV